MIKKMILVFVLLAATAFGRDRYSGGSSGELPFYYVVASDATAKEKQINTPYKCDGTADQVEIQAAINNTGSTGGKVMLSTGTFNISAPVFLYGGTRLEGCGLGQGNNEKNTTLYLSNGSNCDVIIIDNRTGHTQAFFPAIANLAINGNASNNTGGTYETEYRGMICMNTSNYTTASDIIFENLFIYNCRGSGIWVGITQSNWNIFGNNLWIENCGRNGFKMRAATKVYMNNIFIYATGEVDTAVGNGAGILFTSQCYQHFWNNVYIQDAIGEGIYITYQSTEASRYLNFNNLSIEDKASGSTSALPAIYVYGGISGGNTYLTPISFNNLTINPNNNRTYDISISKHPSATVYPDNISINNFSSGNFRGINIGNGCNQNGQIYNIFSNVFTDLPAAATDNISADALIASGTRTIAAQPAYPRNLAFTITDTDTSITAFTITIIGTGAKGQPLTEAFSFTSGLTFSSNHAYATVTSITVSGLTGNDGSDNLKVGVGDKVGLQGNTNYTSSVYKLLVDGSNTAIPAYSTSYGTLDLSASTPDGSKDFMVYLKTAR
jgi:hypothetical protein